MECGLSGIRGNGSARRSCGLQILERHLWWKARLRMKIAIEGSDVGEEDGLGVEIEMWAENLGWN